MAFMKLCRFALAGVVLLASTSISVIGTASTASATTGDNGGCPNRPIRVHTSDTRPFHGWACWIDDGDDIRVCDSDAGDPVHVHASLWVDIGVWWQLVATNDGDDPGCDQPSAVDISGFERLRLRICAERQDGSRFDCDQVIWNETN